jgi:hypothetical protein
LSTEEVTMAKTEPNELDLAGLSDRAIQRLLREIDATLLARALRASTKQVVVRIFRNVSKGAAANLKDEMGRKAPDARRQTELAVKRINAVIAAMIETGDIRRGDTSPTRDRRSAPAITIDPSDAESVRESFLAIAEKVRRDGLLSLERDVDKVEDPFLQAGLRLVIDGTDPELVERILRNQMESYEEMERVRIAQTTLWMERELAQEMTRRRMVLDGVLAVQQGDTSRMLAQRLDSHRAE